MDLHLIYAYVDLILQSAYGRRAWEVVIPEPHHQTPHTDFHDYSSDPE